MGAKFGENRVGSSQVDLRIVEGRKRSGLGGGEFGILFWTWHTITFSGNFLPLLYSEPSSRCSEGICQSY